MLKYFLLMRVFIALSILALIACQTAPADQQQTTEKLSINMQDMSYTPDKLNVSHAGRYHVQIKNTSTIAHDIVFSNGVRVDVGAGKETTLILDIPASGLHFFCSLPGHKQAGMTGVVTVNNQVVKETNDAIETKPAASTPVDTQHTTNVDYTLHDAKAPSLVTGKVHEIYLTAEEKEIVVAKGITQQLWTYNGQVPGPVLHVKVGDTVRVHLKNLSTNKLPHSVDFHASEVAWNDEMTSINPNEEKLYEWKANYAGVWMYHCGSNPALHHIASGMYGMVIVEPKEGLPKVDHEFAIVQSEFYLGKAGDITDLHKAGNHHPDYVVFNGVANQYKDHPIEIGTGKKVRIYVLNAGPNEDSSFHIVGTIFNHVIKEGIELAPNNKGHYGVQAVDLAPAQGAIIEFNTAEDGLYPMVTHAFNFVGKGALGLFKSGDGDPKN